MNKKPFIIIGIVLLLAALAYGAAGWLDPAVPLPPAVREALDAPSPVEQKDPADYTAADLILLGARAEVKNGTRYDVGGGYYQIDYPGGDIDPALGVCTDVVIRALRHAGFDLQELIHRDMRANFALYPQNWGLSGADSNIDHRRIPNQVKFMERYGQELGTDPDGGDWQHGDIVYWLFPDGREHCGIISDRSARDGRPLVIHNAGLTAEQDCLTRWEITGHYRYPADPGE